MVAQSIAEIVSRYVGLPVEWPDRKNLNVRTPDPQCELAPAFPQFYSLSGDRPPPPGRGVCWRNGASEGCCLYRPGVLAGLDHGRRHRCTQFTRGFRGPPQY